jgi:hypothetical protein
MQLRSAVLCHRRLGSLPYRIGLEPLPFIHAISFLKDWTGQDRPFTLAAPLLRENPVFQVAPRHIVERMHLGAGIGVVMGCPRWPIERCLQYLRRDQAGEPYVRDRKQSEHKTQLRPLEPPRECEDRSSIPAS